MTVQAGDRATALATAATATTTAARKAVAKTADFKNSLARAQAPFAPTPRATLAATGSAALLAQEEARGRPAARRVALVVPRPSASQPAASQPAAPQPTTGDAALRSRIAVLESGREPNRGYTARNAASGALGRYQMLPIALRDIGWQDAQGRWTAAAARQGVTSEAGFLASPSAQEAAMDAYLQRKSVQLSANGSLAAVGSTVAGSDGGAVPVTEAGLIAAAHRRGAGTVARWLAHRLNTPDAPVPVAQRVAFANVEQRLRDFANVPYGAQAVATARPAAAVAQPAI